MQVGLQSVKDVSIARQLYERVAAGDILEKVQVFYTADVLERYRTTDGYKIIRTDTSGRVSKAGSWSVDFGISGDEDTLLHTSVEALVHRIPEREREHWLNYMVTAPLSANYVKGLIRPGCLDDGPIRVWS
jgi:hypothetical protein